MSETETQTIDHDETEFKQPLRRGDMLGPQALTTFQERGAVTGAISTADRRGGLRFENALQMMEMAKMMALADKAVPAHLRANPGACLRIVMHADEWGFSPFAVGDKSYLVNDRIAFESQLIHAVIERHAPLTGRLRPTWDGEGPTRRCTVTGYLYGEEDPFVWAGPQFQQIKVKNSPEWAANPDKQLFYHSSRDWARIYCPDVLLGVYSRDEMGEGYGADRAREIPRGTIADRLPPADEGGTAQYDEDGLANALAPANAAGSISEPGEKTDIVAEPEKTPAKRNRKPAETPAETVQQSPEKTAEPATDAQATPAAPKTGADYVAYAREWFAKGGDPEAAVKRWSDEKELRVVCKLTVTDNKMLRIELSKKFGVMV